VIRSFRDKDTETIWQRRYVKKPSPEPSRLADNTLVLINSAESINDLRIAPGNRLEKLAGKYGIRVDDQWRIFYLLTGQPESAIHRWMHEIVPEVRCAITQSSGGR
jgi:proteic killer suppression protein